LYYNDPNKLVDAKPNLLEHLIRHQEGLDPVVPNDGDHMLDRFTTDMQMIAQEGGLTMTDTNLNKSLIAFAMQAYYENRLETDKTLFSNEGVSGGIRFSFSDVANTPDDAKGYMNYFQDFLATLPEEERALINLELPYLRDWFIQAGASGMNATAGDERALMLGGTGGDTLTGGSKADLLIGGEGSDTLTGGGDADYLFGRQGQDTLIGGQGNDTLIGGKGFDTYIWNSGDGNDTIIEEEDDDGKIHGIIKINNGAGLELTAGGGFIREGTSNIWNMTTSDGSVFTLTHNSPWKLVLADGSELGLGDFEDGNDLLEGGDGGDILVTADDHYWRQAA
ncbi:MAG: hypothetical protein AB1649_34860, partial [Chloroflexota bacterium]